MELDEAAIAKQRLFRRLEQSLAVLAVLAAFLAILSKSIPFMLSGIVQSINSIIPGRIFLILVPIAISIITAYNSHFREGNKWVLLRGSAEALKREIFRFRVRAGVYSDQQCLENSREFKLASRITDITASLEKSEVNKTSLAVVTGQKAPGSFLSPDEYVEARIEDQIRYFETKTQKLSKELSNTQIYIYVAGGAATFIAAIGGYGVWVALPTAIVTALTTKLQSEQVENSLIQYNQALVSLRNIDLWWKALSHWEKGRQANIDLLVDETEKTLEAENAGWVQTMQSALEKLTEKEPTKR
jgi:hypothetical protein